MKLSRSEPCNGSAVCSCGELDEAKDLRYTGMDVEESEP